jgi:hypothetical protein
MAHQRHIKTCRSRLAGRSAATACPPTVCGVWANRFYPLGSIGLIVLAGGLGLSGCRPAPQQFEIASSSMAPTLLGPTFQAQCPTCRWQFRIAAETYRPGLPTRCHQCGDQCDVGQTQLPGDTVALKTVPVPPIWPRLELVAFGDRQAGPPRVKRIWGLPGERLSLRAGELYLTTVQDPEPRLFQKSMAELERVCVQVSSFPTDRSSHWFLCRDDRTPAQACLPIESAVQSMSGQTKLSLPPGSVLRWYAQRPAAVHPRDVPTNQWLIPSHLLDDYAINQGVSCNLHKVSDYMVSIQLHAALTGKLVIEMRCAGETITVVCSNPTPEPGHSLHSAAASSSGAAGRGQGVAVQAARRIQIAWCDQRLLIQSDKQTALFAARQLAPLFTAKTTHCPSEPNMLIKLSGAAELAIEQLIVARDLYFEDWDEPAGQSSGYFLMGDNLPVSVDSRSRLGRISADQILGRVAPR